MAWIAAVAKNLGLSPEMAELVKTKNHHVIATQPCRFLPRVADIDPRSEIGVVIGYGLGLGIGFFHGLIAGIAS